MTVIPSSMLAPCGLTCAACYAHVRKKNACAGCRADSAEQPAYCGRCKIKACAESRGVKFCFRCKEFPCVLIKKIDKRYRKSYNISLIENGVRAKTAGVKEHLREEKEKWACPDCGGVISLHSKTCSECGRDFGSH
jgi:hypothetical protein